MVMGTSHIQNHHHSFNVSVPLKGGSHGSYVCSELLSPTPFCFAGSALDSFQCLRSLLIVSFHVFFGPSTSTLSNNFKFCDAVNTTIIPYKHAQNQRSRSYRNKVCMLLIHSFLRRESELNVVFQTHITCPPNHCSIITLQSAWHLGAQHSLAYNKTVRIYVLYICPHVVYERAREV